MSTGANAPLDQNSRQGLYGLSSANDGTRVDAWVNPVTHALLTESSSGGGGTGTYWAVTGTINGSNVTFSIATAVGSDFVLSLARQLQIQDIGATMWDYSYTTGGGTTTITYHTAPDASLSGQPHVAYVVS